MHAGPTPWAGPGGALRPHNPTPGHAQGQGSPASVRPLNPTPGQAMKMVPDRPGAPTPKQGQDSTSPNTHQLEQLSEEMGAWNVINKLNQTHQQNFSKTKMRLSSLECVNKFIVCLIITVRC